MVASIRLSVITSLKCLSVCQGVYMDTRADSVDQLLMLNREKGADSATFLEF